MEAIQRDYAPKGVKFYYIYKALAHPEMNGYITPFTLEERLMHVQEAETKLGSRIEWLCDNMSNDLKHALGNAPNSEFVIDPNGVVVSRRAWSDPEELRRFLEKTVGPVENPTRASDLNMKVDLRSESHEIPTGVVPRVQLPGRMIPLKAQPLIENNETPFYVKLRAEGDSSLLRQKSGKLYLGFFLDRIYAVHWNNLTKPVEFEIKAPEGVRLTPSQSTGPKVEAPADKDPREFLVDVSANSFAKPLEVTVRYFACDDANTFCIPVTQYYSIQLERDPDGGMRRSRGMVPGRPREFIARLMQRDRNGDGKISREEAPEQMLRRFDQMDANGDGFIDQEELQKAAERFPGRPNRR